MSDLAQTLESAAQVERRSARRRLLATPLVGQREDPDAYVSILRHRRALTEWFADHTGWHLTIDESGGFARLHKTSARRDGTRPALCGHDHHPFDRRRYALLCLALAALDQRRGQTTLRHVADAVTTASRDLGDREVFDATRLPERRALVDVLKLLASLGVLRARDGDSDRYALVGAGDVLYDVDDRRIAQLISAPSSPSLVAGPDDLPLEVYPDTEEGARLRARHGVMRRLLDDPVVYYDELDEGEREWIAHALGFVHERLEADLGLLVERRAEGLAAVDPERELSDESFPDGSSTVKHAALLLAELLTARARPRPDAPTAGAPRAAVVVTDAEIAAWTVRLCADVGARCGWRAAYVESEPAAAALAAEALALLARFGLVRRVEGGWEPRPAIARFAPAPVGAQGAPAAPRGGRGPARPAEGQGSLFAGESDAELAAEDLP